MSPHAAQVAGSHHWCLPTSVPPQGLGILSPRHTSGLHVLTVAFIPSGRCLLLWVLLRLPSASFCPVFVHRLGLRPVYHDLELRVTSRCPEKVVASHKGHLGVLWFALWNVPCWVALSGGKDRRKGDSARKRSCVRQQAGSVSFDLSFT